MIHATLATYPARLTQISAVIESIAPQVDRLNVVLNEYDTIPECCLGWENVFPIIPNADTKDTGKFLFAIEPQDWLFTLDDDIFYPPDYVKRSIEMLEGLGKSHLIGGYHASIYHKHRYLNSRWLRRVLGRNPNFIVGSRRITGFSSACPRPRIVDQLGTGTAFMRGCDVPPFAAVKHGQKYIDIAAAKYWYQMGCTLVCLPREAKWIKAMDPMGESIIDDFTNHQPSHVADEVYGFVFKRSDIGDLV